MSAARPFRIVSRRRRARPQRRRPDEELGILRREVSLRFRGKELVNAKTITEFCEEADSVPGLSESVERVLSFFEQEANGRWIEDTAVFRLTTVDLATQLKRTWREFEHRRSTLRQYLDGDADAAKKDEGPSLLFKLPEQSLQSLSSFETMLRGVAGALDAICRNVLDAGFTVIGFREQSAWIGVRPESDVVLALAKQVFKIFSWHQKQCDDVRRLEAHASISSEYVKAAKSLRSAQERHLVVLIDKSLEDTADRLSEPQRQEAAKMVKDYVETLGALMEAGAEISIPVTLSPEERASWPSAIAGSLSE